MGCEISKLILTLLALGMSPIQMAAQAAQCEAVKNTGSPASPSSDTGRCLSEGSSCSVVGENGASVSLNGGKCANSGGPGYWSCGCFPNGVVSSYLVLNPGALTLGGQRDTATASIYVLSVNGFSGTIKASCRITVAPSNTNPPCSVTPTSQTIGSSGGGLTLSVPTQGLIPGNYTVEVDASTDSPSAFPNGIIVPAPPSGPLGPPSTSNHPPYNTSLVLSVPVPNASGGTPLALICFAVLLGLWAWRYNQRAGRRSRL
jgi:hypothetical protein